jgi:two-component system chemotaxis response regulator CheY
LRDPDAEGRVTLVPAHRCTVLVVDDDPEIRELLRVALTGEGYDVAGVPNGREALHYLRSHAETCMIVLDLVLPVMDGAQFRRAQLQDRSLAWIPVIVVSAVVDAHRRARELGARHVLRKPLDLDDVRDTLRRVGCCQARPRAAREPASRSV